MKIKKCPNCQSNNTINTGYYWAAGIATHRCKDCKSEFTVNLFQRRSYNGKRI